MDIVESIERYIAGTDLTPGTRTRLVRARDEIVRLRRSQLTPEPAQQEPVAVVSGYYGGQCVILPIDPARIFNSNTALYTKDQL